MKAYFFAPFSPLGRLPLTAYWALSTPIMFLIIGLHWYSKSGADFTSGLQSLAVFLMWVEFCLLSRRLQDCGWPGLVALPLVGTATFVLLVDLDPFLLGTAISLQSNGASSARLPRWYRGFWA